MLPHDVALEQNEYRLVLVKSGSHAIWAENTGEMWRLPRIAIPRCTRPAEKLQQAMERAWLLCCVVVDFLPAGKCSTPCVVAEILPSHFPHGLTATGIDEIPAEEMTSEERQVVEDILSGETGTRGPFSRIGWITEAMEWLHAAVGYKVVLAGGIRQYNAGGNFALVRFATEAGPAYWLKATGDPNTHEFHITEKLAELCPESLPRRIAARVDWNAWLMEDAGQPLDSWNLSALEQTVLCMAGLQKKSIGLSHEFLTVGAFDQRLGNLRAHLPKLFEYLDEAMAKQTSVKVQRIEKRRLWQMADTLQDACSRMEDLGIPDTLIHNDINSGNILFRGTHCVFTDWCEVGVGNPFLTFQHLCLLQFGNGVDWSPRLREAYKRCWLEDHLSASQIEQALALMPLLAILSYFYGRGTWLRSPRRYEPRFEMYARSLARHMDRASQDCQLMEVLCH
jgi:hypothetical protein